MNGPDPLMTSAQVCAAFQVSQQTLCRWRHTGKLTAIILPSGRSARYLRAEVQAFLTGQPLTPEQITALRHKLLDGAP